MEALEAAMIAAYRKTPGAWAQNVRIGVDPKTGESRVIAQLVVVEEVQDRRTQISVDEAHKINPEAELGEIVEVDVTPKDFGRIAAQTAKQVILQRIREAEREVTYHTYANREGEIVQGTIQSTSPDGITISLDRAEAILPRANQMPTEQYPRNQRIRVYVEEVRKTPRGPEIIVSRTHKNMLRRLMEVEVPEIFNGAVEIKAIAREAGSRSKVAVAARQEGVDPVGACVGIRGVRIQALVNELNGEKIDVVAWDPDPAVFIANALSPAQVTKVRLIDAPEGRTAEVVVPDRQLSLAIGKEGQNARLAAKLTGWRIDIKSETEAKEEAIRRAEEQARRAAELKALEEARALLAEAEAKEAEPEEAAHGPAGKAEAPAEQVTPETLAQVEPVAETAVEEPTEAQPTVPGPPPMPEAAPASIAAEAESTTALERGVEAEKVAEPSVPAPSAAAAGEPLPPGEEKPAEEEEKVAEKEGAQKRKKKGKKKRKQRELVFDEELGEVVVRKKRKPGRRHDQWEREIDRWQWDDLAEWEEELEDFDEEVEEPAAEDEDYRQYLDLDEEDGS